MLYHGAARHLPELLAAHQLLLAVSDVCHQACQALQTLASSTQPLLVSTLPSAAHTHGRSLHRHPPSVRRARVRGNP